MWSLWDYFFYYVTKARNWARDSRHMTLESSKGTKIKKESTIIENNSYGYCYVLKELGIEITLSWPPAFWCSIWSESRIIPAQVPQTTGFFANHTFNFSKNSSWLKKMFKVVDSPPDQTRKLINVHDIISYINNLGYFFGLSVSATVYSMEKVCVFLQDRYWA